MADDPVSEMRLFLRRLAQMIVDSPEAVRVEAVPRATADSPDAVVFVLHGAPSDVGKLIGMNGRMARSLRVILGSVGKKYSRNFTLDISEPPGHNQSLCPITTDKSRCQ